MKFGPWLQPRNSNDSWYRRAQAPDDYRGIIFVSPLQIDKEKRAVPEAGWYWQVHVPIGGMPATEGSIFEDVPPRLTPEQARDAADAWLRERGHVLA